MEDRKDESDTSARYVIQNVMDQLPEQNFHGYDKTKRRLYICSNTIEVEEERIKPRRFHNFSEFYYFMEKSKIQFEEAMSVKCVYEDKLDDFDMYCTLGCGVFGEVVLVKRKNFDKYSSMTVIKIETVVQQNNLEYIKREKKILESLISPFTIYLESFFHDECYAYFVTPVMPMMLFDILLKFGKLDENEAKFYISQVVLALEYLHFLDIIYRDLKPENILICENGYIKLSSFGFCKRLDTRRTYTICGTPQYLPPEVILNKGYGKAASWWGMGVLTYELVAGYPPFRVKKGDDDLTLYGNIVDSRYTNPKHFSCELKDLIKHLLISDVTLRIGNLQSGVNDVRYHKWFKTTNWLSILNRTTPPPYKPKNKLPKCQNEECFWLDKTQCSSNNYENVFDDF